MRWYHKMYARFNGYFWLPCPICGKEFGGHEWRDLDGLPSVISDGAPGRGRGICPTCTRAGLGHRIW